YPEFTEMLRTRLAALTLGDPTLESTDLGPIARDDLRQNLHRQVTETVSAGARCLLGGELPEGEGYFYPVTLLADVSTDMCAFREETFGPVMAVAPVADLEQAISIANATEYGLGAALWMADT